jgi:SAM-dependent methyltransferase
MGELYDLASPYAQRADPTFYREEAEKSRGKVLEVACGTGRVLLPIARKGISIVGIDRSPAMLERCYELLAREPKEVQERVRLEQMDMRTFNLGERFALAIIPFRPLQHMVKVADQLSTFRSIHRHLDQGGHLVFDVFNPDLKVLAAGPGEEHEDFPLTKLLDGRSVRRTARVTGVHPSRQTSDVELTYYVTDTSGKAEKSVMRFPMRWFGRFEIEHLLERCGFGVKAVYGNFDRSELTDGSPEMIFVAERR